MHKVNDFQEVHLILCQDPFTSLIESTFEKVQMIHQGHTQSA